MKENKNDLFLSESPQKSTYFHGGKPRTKFHYLDDSGLYLMIAGDTDTNKTELRGSRRDAGHLSFICLDPSADKRKRFGVMRARNSLVA